MILTMAMAVLAQSTVTVFAAASLKDAFTAIGEDFERANPTYDVRFSFAGSQTLSAQIRQGAPADVFASADRKHVADSQFDLATIRVFARNRLVIVFRKSFTAKSAKDLSRADRIVLGDDSVPIGKYTRVFLDRARSEYGSGWLLAVNQRVVSKELDVRSMLAKVKLGEADAGVVYYSDWIAAKGEVILVGIPERLNVVAEYPVALTRTAKNRPGGRAFVNYLLTRNAQAALKKNGFMEAPK